MKEHKCALFCFYFDKTEILLYNITKDKITYEKD